MRDGRISHDISTVDSSLARMGDVITRCRAFFRCFTWLGRRQWLVLLGMGVIVILIEVRNHTHMWHQHQSGQTFWSDSELIWEIVLYGLVFPILTGILLGYMGRTVKERDKISEELALRRRVVAQMKAAQGWHELAQLVVTAPGNVVAADRAWLLARRSGQEEFVQITHWERPENRWLPPAPPITTGVCEHCAAASLLHGTRIATCMLPDAGGSSLRWNRYCLSLSPESTGKALLLFDVLGDTPLDMDQMKVLDDLGDEMSLAIDNSNLHYVQQRQGDVARNERLRIARDLHDTLGQNISVLRLKLEQLSTTEAASDRNEFQAELAGILVIAGEAYEQVRDTLEELRTTEHQDLEDTIRLHAEQAAKRAGFAVHVHFVGQPLMVSARKSRQIMYIVREALNNVEKHAGAQHVDIGLQWDDGELKLTVRDDGQGFHPEALDAGDRYGMVIMRERSRAIDAHLAVESTPGKGTELTLSVPLSRSTVASQNP